jgi:hypothetical protein
MNALLYNLLIVEPFIKRQLGYPNRPPDPNNLKKAVSAKVIGLASADLQQTSDFIDGIGSLLLVVR